MRAFWKKLKATLFRRRAERELEEDVRCHLDMLVEENIRNGMDPEEARYAARRSFGGVEQVKETYRDKRGLRWLDSLLQDLRFGLRMLRRNPLLTVVAIVTLGLGIGGNTTFFSVIRAVLLKQLVYRDPDRLVYLSADNARRNKQDIPFTLIRLEEMRAASRSFTNIGAFLSSAEDVTLSGTGEPEVLKGARVSANFLDILGLQPLLGRSFFPEEDTPSGAPVAMISASLWKRRFGADPMIIGGSLALNSTLHTIISVLPPDFQFPFAGVDIWVTRPSEWSRLPPRYWRTVTLLKGFARLKPDVSLEQAQAEMVVLNNRYLAAHPDFGAVPGVTMRVASLKDRLVQNVRPMLLTLFGAVGFVLLIACANVASLMLARATSRSREFAVRAALGAGRGRLIRQLLAESLVLAMVGGILGLLLANWGLHVIAGMNVLDHPTRVGALSVPGAEQVSLDGIVLVFTVALSMATGVLFGLFPSLRISRPDLAGVLRESGAAAGRGSGRRRVLHFSGRSLLVIGQVALSIILLIGAMLLIESLNRLNDVNPGFQTTSLLTAKLSLPSNRYDTDQKRVAFFEQVVMRTEAIPGVDNATVAMSLPTTPWIWTDVKVKEQPPTDPNEVPTAQLQSVTPQTAYLAARIEGDPLGVVDSIRSQVLAIDRDQPISEVKTMQARFDAAIGQRRLMTMLLGSFAAVALLLAIIGIYGVIAYAVVQRTQEVGIRRALGAPRADILWLLLRQGLGLVLAGEIVGIAGAFLLVRVMNRFLFGVKATDPAIIVGTAMVFLVVGLAASYIPARRATRIDPMAALRVG